jgi:phage terminase large subunit-like protein
VPLALVPKVPPLLDYIPTCDPRWTNPPTHLKEFVDVLEQAPYGSLRVLCSCPIRHYKTSCVIGAIAHWLKRYPKLRIIYMTFGIKRAENVSKDIRDTCQRMGIDPKKGFDTIQTWRNEEGGGVSVMSAQQSRLGEDVDILIVDDPFESGTDADKPEIRQTVDDTIAHYTMRLSRGGSCIVVMSRWHPDDAIGRREKIGWRYIHRRAVETINGERVALAPEVRTLKELDDIRDDIRKQDPTERIWFSQWQNEPFTPSTNYLSDPLRYSVIPGWQGYIDAMGIDMAFTKGRLADWFAIVVVRIYMGSVYIRNAYRFKGDPREAAVELRVQQGSYGVVPIFSYVSGPERVAIGSLAEQGIAVQPMQAETNKLWRAQKMINLWNAGRILVPSHAPWVGPFIERAKNFRGVDGDDDDEVDALVSVVNAMMFGSGSGGTLVLGRRCM